MQLVHPLQLKIAGHPHRNTVLTAADTCQTRSRPAHPGSAKPGTHRSTSGPNASRAGCDQHRRGRRANWHCCQVSAATSGLPSWSARCLTTPIMTGTGPRLGQGNGVGDQFACRALHIAELRRIGSTGLQPAAGEYQRIQERFGSGRVVITIE